MVHRPASVALALSLAVGAALLPAPSLEAQSSFTLEQVMASPFPTALVASAEGDGLAWVENLRGRRNVWVALGPDFRGRRLTSYDRDDGQEITDLAWTPDGRTLVYVRGAAPNRFGDVPNPAGDPVAPTRDVWRVGLDGGEPVKLAEGARPRISPDGGRVLFLRGGQVWTVTLDDDGAEATALFHVGRGVGAAEWSPDGTMVAFSTGRGDHGFVGVYHLDPARLVYMDPGVDRDGSPVWSPDSERLAFLRQPNVQDALPFFARRSGHPWSIRVADPDIGASTEVFRAREGTGSVFRTISAANPLTWGAGDHIVFPWEAEGWTHLYSVPAGGGDPTLLTPGAFEVQWVSLAPDGEQVLYSSNQDDPDRQHLWSVDVRGGTPRSLTDGTGVEWSPVRTPGGTLAWLGSSATRPAMVKVGSGEEALEPASDALPEDFPTTLVEPEAVVFSSTDGLPIHGQLLLPPDLASGERRPALLFLHGGSRRQMLLGFHHRSYYHNAFAMNQYLASLGFVVLSVNYRSGIGYGMEFREALKYGASGGAEVQDVLAAGLYLKGRADVDPDRIGLWGGSYGGYLTAMGLAKASDLFAAGVDFHGVHDWNTGIRNFVPSYEPDHHPELARVAFQASPLAWVDDWRSPVLMIHGDDDRNVNFNETVRLVEQLRARGVETRTLVFPDEVHGFLLHDSWLRAYRATANFFREKLGGG